MTTPPIFVISLARAKDRRAFMQKQLQDARLEYEIWEAIDGKTLSPADYQIPLNDEYWRKRRGWKLTPGEIGCFLSHWTLWREVANRGISVALILEDDAVLPRDMNFLPEVLQAKTDWEFMRLHLFKSRPYSVAESLPSGRKIVVFRKRIGGTVAYLVRLETAHKLLRICDEMRMPVDWMFGEWWRNGLKEYGVIPPPFGHADGESMIAVSGVRRKMPRTFGEHLGSFFAKVSDWHLHRKMVRQRTGE